MIEGNGHSYITVTSADTKLLNNKFFETLDALLMIRTLSLRITHIAFQSLINRTHTATKTISTFSRSNSDSNRVRRCYTLPWEGRPKAHTLKVKSFSRFSFMLAKSSSIPCRYLHPKPSTSDASNDTRCKKGSKTWKLILRLV